MPDVSLFDLGGQNALVTGSARGLGRACAYALAMSGANVAIVDVDEEVGSGTVASIRGMGREAIFVRCDIADPVQIQAMVDTVARRFGRLDIAVNNAGIYRRGLDEVQPKEE